MFNRSRRSCSSGSSVLSSLDSKDLCRIAQKNGFYAVESNNIKHSLKKISSSEKKIICIFGSPCQMFVEDPMKYYNTEDECKIVAEEKAESMIKTFTDFGYYVESQAHACQYVIEDNEV